MQTRQSKRLRDETESDGDVPLSSLTPKPNNSVPQPHASTKKMKEKGKEKVTEQGSSSKAHKTDKHASDKHKKSKKKKKSRYKESSRSKRHHRSFSMPVTSSQNLSDKFFRGLNFELRFKTSIVSKIIVFEKTIDMFIY